MVAICTARGLIDRIVLEFCLINLGRQRVKEFFYFCFLFIAHRDLFFTVFTEDAHEPLRDRERKRRPDAHRFDAKIDEARDGTHGIVRVKR